MSVPRFDPMVDAYDAARPGYPPALLTLLADLVGPLAGRDVVELAAGTGIATRLLRSAGARVLATDIGPAMLGRLRRHDPTTPAVLADAHRLPVPDARVDLLACAQAWHWFDVPVAAGEAARVLRPGGALACWWNDVDAPDEPWWQRQQQRLEAANPGYRRDYRTRDYAAELASTGRFAAVRGASLRWSRRLSLADYQTWLLSKSYVVAIGDGLEDFLAAERRSMAEAFPAGVVTEPFRLSLVLASTP